MREHLLSAIRLTALAVVLLSGLYPLILLGIAKAMPGKGQGSMIVQGGISYYGNIGQSFTEDKYFWSRPSAVDYNASGSGGSNKGPANPDYLRTVQSRIDTFLVHNPGIKKSEIPVDLITASGSGLDPDISLQAARVQAKRIAAIRNIAENKIQQLISASVEKPFCGLLGPKKINVLKLNLALDTMK